MQNDTISEDVTPTQTGGQRSHGIHSSSRVWQRPKVTILEPVRTTPVTSIARAPFTPRINQRQSSLSAGLATSIVRRKLFSVGNTPKRKRRRSNLQPLAFKINGGKERTQPMDERGERKGLRPRGGFLTSQLTSHVNEARGNIRMFRSELASTESDLSQMQSLMDKSLVLSVLRVEDEVVISKRWGSISCTNASGIEFALIVTEDHCEGELKLRDLRQGAQDLLLFVPCPWYAMRLKTTSERDGLLMVTSYRLDILRSTPEHIAVLKSLTLNSELRKWQNVNGFYGSQYEVSETQDSCDPEEEHNRSPDDDGAIRAFSDISPHMTAISVSASITACRPDVNVALLCDGEGNHAILRCGPTAIQVSPERRKFVNLIVSDDAMPLEIAKELFSAAPGANEAMCSLRKMKASQGVLVLSGDASSSK